jgi:hypothetical protein
VIISIRPASDSASLGRSSIFAEPPACPKGLLLFFAQYFSPEHGEILTTMLLFGTGLTGLVSITYSV